MCINLSTRNTHQEYQPVYTTSLLYAPHHACLSLATVSFASRSGWRYCLRKRCLMMAGRCRNVHSQTRCDMMWCMMWCTHSSSCWPGGCARCCVPLQHPVQADAYHMLVLQAPPSPCQPQLVDTFIALWLYEAIFTAWARNVHRCGLKN